MPEATRHSSENDAIDWRDLADQIFPADALRTTRQRSIRFQPTVTRTWGAPVAPPAA
jgi:hypothetical protein